MKLKPLADRVVVKEKNQPLISKILRSVGKNLLFVHKQMWSVLIPTFFQLVGQTGRVEKVHLFFRQADGKAVSSITSPSTTTVMGA